MQQEKKKRGPNFTEGERKLLFDVMESYLSTIENKKTDAITCKEKDAAWEKLTDEFNTNTTGMQRTTAQLKVCYENCKRRAKKRVADEKVERYKTGGGTFLSEVTEDDIKLISRMKAQFVPHANITDSDAGHHSSLQEGDQEEPLESEVVIEPEEQLISPSGSAVSKEDWVQPSCSAPPQKKRRKEEDCSLRDFAESKCSLNELKKKFLTEKHELEMRILETELDIKKTELEIKKKQLSMLDKN